MELKEWVRTPYRGKQYADSTLRGMKKDELIQIIRDYEHNYNALYEANERGIRAATKMLITGEAEWRYQTMTVPGGKGQTYTKWSCSACKGKQKKRSRYCPDCGKRMKDGGQDDV